NLVARAEAWRWGSLQARRTQADGDRPALTPWPITRPRDWTARVNRPLGRQKGMGNGTGREPPSFLGIRGPHSPLRTTSTSRLRRCGELLQEVNHLRSIPLGGADLGSGDAAIRRNEE